MVPDWKRYVKIAVPLLLAVASALFLARPLSSAEFHADTIRALDEKRVTVMELAAASTAASAAITLLPGDTATPIAEKLTDLSSWFLLVLCAILLEKYLLTATGYAAFVVLFPGALALTSLYFACQNEGVKQLAKKLALFGLAIILVVPVSVRVSALIENTYSDSVNAALESALEATEEIEQSSEEKNGGLAGILDQLGSGISSSIERLNTVLNRFVEAIAVLLVTSCVIPVAVLLFFAWLTKVILMPPVDFSVKKRVRPDDRAAEEPRP